MNTHYATLEIPATPDYVLGVFRDWDRQAEQYDPSIYPERPISFETKVRDWIWKFEIENLKLCYAEFNRAFGINATRQEWSSVMEPDKTRCLRDVCEMISRHAKRSVVRPANLLGKPCLSAGTFLTIRSLLHEHGVDVTSIAPSTPLADYAHRHPEIFVGPVSQLAPGALPLIRKHWPLAKPTKWFLIFGALNLLFAWLLSLPLLTAIGYLLLIVGVVLYLVQGFRGPKSTQFGELRTFRDLSRVIAERHPAWS